MNDILGSAVLRFIYNKNKGHLSPRAVFKTTTRRTLADVSTRLGALSYAHTNTYIACDAPSDNQLGRWPWDLTLTDAVCPVAHGSVSVTFFPEQTILVHTDGMYVLNIKRSLFNLKDSSHIMAVSLKLSYFFLSTFYVLRCLGLGTPIANTTSGILHGSVEDGGCLFNFTYINSLIFFFVIVLSFKGIVSTIAVCFSRNWNPFRFPAICSITHRLTSMATPSTIFFHGETRCHFVWSILHSAICFCYSGIH